MNGTRWLWIGIGALVLSLGVFSWTEHETHVDLQHNLSTWVHRDITIENLSLGVFGSGVRGLVIPAENRTTFTNDVEVGSIEVDYMPSVFIEDMTILNKVEVDGLIIHWEGLLGTNIRQIIDNIKGNFPRTRRVKRTAKNPNRTLEIKEMLLTNTTIVVHLRNNTEAIVLPDITLIDIHGSHSHVIKQIVKQIQLGIIERRNK